jgi:hypothetical protein
LFRLQLGSDVLDDLAELRYRLATLSIDQQASLSCRFERRPSVPGDSRPDERGKENPDRAARDHRDDRSLPTQRHLVLHS